MADATTFDCSPMTALDSLKRLYADTDSQCEITDATNTPLKKVRIRMKHVFLTAFGEEREDISICVIATHLEREGVSRVDVRAPLFVGESWLEGVDSGCGEYGGMPFPEMFYPNAAPGEGQPTALGGGVSTPSQNRSLAVDQADGSDFLVKVREGLKDGAVAFQGLMPKHSLSPKVHTIAPTRRRPRPKPSLPTRSNRLCTIAIPLALPLGTASVSALASPPPPIYLPLALPLGTASVPTLAFDFFLPLAPASAATPALGSRTSSDMTRSIFEECYVLRKSESDFRNCQNSMKSIKLSVMHEKLKEVCGVRYPFGKYKTGVMLSKWIKDSFDIVDRGQYCNQNMFPPVSKVKVISKGSAFHGFMPSDPAVG